MARRKRLPTQKLHEIVCMILENALHGDKGYSTDAEGYITIQEIHAHLLNEQDKLVGDGNGLYYEDCYNISELIRKVSILGWNHWARRYIVRKPAGLLFIKAMTESWKTTSPLAKCTAANQSKKECLSLSKELLLSKPWLPYGIASGPSSKRRIGSPGQQSFLPVH